MRRLYLSTNTKLAIVAAVLVGGAAFMWGAIYVATANQSSTGRDATPVETLDISLDSNETAGPSEVAELSRRTDGVLVPGNTANRQPIAVMIENAAFGGVRPQAGLGEAEIVYEVLVEGGITRYMAIFSSDDMPEKIGPVRSARPTYIEFLSEYDALFAHAGGSPEALKSIDGLEIKDLDALTYGVNYFFRDSARVAPHNLFTSNELLTEALTELELDAVESEYDSWEFQEETIEEDEEKDEEHFVEIDFGSGPLYEARYEYNSATNEYLRFTGGLEHEDANTEEQIAVKNVIVQIVPSAIPVDEEGRVNYEVTSDGDAYIVRDGKVIEGTWQKSDREDRTIFLDEDGDYIQLNRGNTWISVLPITGSIDYN